MEKNRTRPALKERAWTIACFIMGATGLTCILVLNAGIGIFDSFLWWYCETKRLIKEQW